MTASGAPSHASAAHAARLIGQPDRTVQLWMQEAGHKGTWVPGAGYPTALLCAVINDHKWPGKFRLSPEHFRADTAPAADAGESGPPDARADAAALALLGEFRRMLADSLSEQARLAGEVAALRAQLAASDEAREKAAQTLQEALGAALEALERIESGQRRVPWWRRIFAR